MEIVLLVRNWWAIALRGVAAILFGIMAFAVPGITLAALILLFGAYALVDGVLNIIAAVRGRHAERPAWLLLFEGVVSVAAGVVAFLMPDVTALALLYLIGAWAVITGVLEIVVAVRLRRRIQGEWWLALSGVLSVILGVLIVMAPGAGALALVLWIGAYAIVFGALLVALAFRLRRWTADVRERMARAA
jgi:uncharacterized membrane protein HdeD (DUF308 family)